ncbi:hypothetical protein Cwoe_0905 [Conexibacter woesei DSM 14684]|uniref:Uncharacterized protein n=2 Tax=Conexibacter TaxID=191494 RepID=D3FBG9_CONWI|nr:hypothetical protein Cwoe_0905 [Conexibacter woesei DSM 14684]
MNRVKRLALAGAAAVVAVNIWTGAPLLSVWVGSQFVGTTRLSMGAVVIVVVVLAVAVLALVLLLGRLSAAYDRAAGRPAGLRQTSPWLRSMRGERDEDLAESRGFNAVERVVMLSVAACALVFNIWFFFFAGSPLAGG